MKTEFINKDLISKKDFDSILKLYQRGFKQSNWTESDIRKILKDSDNLFVVLRNDNDKIVALSRFKINVKNDPYINRYIPDNKYIIISDLISTIKGGGGFLLNFLLLKYRKNIFLTSIDKETMNFYKKVGFVKCPRTDQRDHRLVMVYYLNKRYRKLYREKTILLIKVEGIKIDYKGIVAFINTIYKNTPVFVITTKEFSKLIYQLTVGDIVIGFHNISKWKGINNKILFNLITPEFNKTEFREKIVKYKKRTDAIG